jgi:hypothetical protein
MKLNKIRSSITLALLLGAAANSANAASITFTYTSPTINGVAASTPLFNIDPFDSTLGKLQSIALTSDFFISGTLGLSASFPSEDQLAEFTDMYDPYGLISLGETLTSSNTGLNDALAGLTLNISDYSKRGIWANDLTSTSAIAGFVWIKHTESTLSDAGVLDLFTGTGDELSIALVLSNLSIESPQPSTARLLNSIERDTFSIVYNYLPADATPPGNSVPEPGSTALLTAGLLGLGFTRRKDSLKKPGA